jgi:hypothetical protein
VCAQTLCVVCVFPAAQEAELAAWMRDNPDAEEAQRVAGGDGSAYRAAAAAAAGGTDSAQAATAAGAAGSQAPRPGPAQQQQQGQAVRGPPLTQAQLCEMAGLPADAPWVPDQLTDEQLTSVLKAVWGHSGFRGQQLPLIRAALQGSSMLGVLPTGLGKSMTYQLPALVMQGEALQGGQSALLLAHSCGARCRPRQLLVTAVSTGWCVCAQAWWWLCLPCCL